MNVFDWNLLGARLVPFAVVALIGLGLADLSWQWLPGLILPMTSRSSKPVNPVTAQNQTVPLASVLDSLRLSNPWENPPIVQEKPLPASVTKEVESSLQLSLIGVMIRPQVSWAVLLRKPAPNTQIVLHVGEKVDGATLQKIERKAVYFDNRGRMERIDMLDGAKPEHAKPESSVPTTATPSPANQTISRADYDAILANGMGLLAGVNVTPFYQGKSSVGYQLKFSDSKPELQKLGLANDDVIQQVNGVPVLDTNRITQLANEMKGQSTVRIDLLRNNQAQTIELNIEK